MYKQNRLPGFSILSEMHTLGTSVAIINSPAIHFHDKLIIFCIKSGLRNVLLKANYLLLLGCPLGTKDTQEEYE